MLRGAAAARTTAQAGPRGAAAAACGKRWWRELLLMHGGQAFVESRLQLLCWACIGRVECRAHLRYLISLC
jgi:hypothetical protein